MPYRIESIGNGRYRVVNAATGDVKARSTSKRGATRQIRLLRGVEHGMVPRGR